MFYQNYSGYDWRSFFTPVVRIITAINVIVFLLLQIPKTGNFILTFFGFYPWWFFSKMMFWQIISYLFIHLGLWHLVINTLMLCMFGPALERYWGSRYFLIFFLFSGVVAGLFNMLFSFDSYVYGCSGAIFGILIAYALVFPDTVLLLFFIFPMPIRYAVIFLIGIDLLAAISSSGNNIAYFAHLGGALGGYLFIKKELFIYKLKAFRFNMSFPKSTNNDINQEVDSILDKISKKGMKSLSKREMEILKRKSKL